MTRLLDVNLLIALAWPSHVHHEAAHRWFADVGIFATCTVTQLGFVRVSSNRAVLADAVSVQAARAVLAGIVAMPQHELWTDDLDFSRDPTVDGLTLVGHRQVTDAFLLALAARHGGRLATLDGGIAALAPTNAAILSLLERVSA